MNRPLKYSELKDEDPQASELIEKMEQVHANGFIYNFTSRTLKVNLQVCN